MKSLMSRQAQAHEDALAHMIRAGVVRVPEDGAGGARELCIDSVIRSQLSGLRQENDMLRVSADIHT